MARDPSRLCHRFPRAAVAVAAAATLTAALVPGVAGAAPPRPKSGGLPDSGPPRTVTLVTGDQVTVTPRRDAKPLVTVAPRPGGDGAGLQMTVTRDRITVIPMDAGRLIAAGRLDRRLFEVDRLIASGYDDARRTGLPLIVKRPGAGVRAGAQRVRSAGSLTAMEVLKSGTHKTWRAFVADGSSRMWLDGKIKASTDGSVPQIGAPAAWQAGLTGKGVKVAVLDTGVDAEHPDLKSTVTGSKNFTTAPSADDVYGHGTHVASVLAGSGAASGGKYKGVAPDASVVSGKVIADNGEGLESWLIDGMTWAAREAEAKVVNLSMTCFCDSPAVDPIEQALNDLSAETGTLFVGAAGDLLWPYPGFIALPAAADAALAVSSVDRQDRPAVSTQGPRLGDYSVKPEIMAPGVGIVAARAKGTGLGAPVDDSYTRLSGTSVATPHVAGAAAILAQQHPDWDGQRIKSTLLASAKNLDGVSQHVQGTGRVDVAKAISQQVSASPATVKADVKWPDSGPALHEQKITYANAATEPVTLDLAIALTGTDGQPLPAAAATLDQTRITVPADGTATVKLTLAGRDGVKAGVFSGHLTAAAAGAPVVRTPVNAYVEPPTASVTVPTTGMDGKPSGLYPFITLSDLSTGESYDVTSDGDSVGHARVPVGKYLLSAHLWTGSSWNSGFQQVVQLGAGATEIPLDARRTTPVRLTNDTPGTTMTAATAMVGYETDKIATYAYYRADAEQQMSLLPVRDPAIRYSVSSLWEGKAQIFRDHRYAVGSIPADPALHTKRAQMAQVRTTVRSHGGTGPGMIRWGGSSPDLTDTQTITHGVERTFPAAFTLYLRADRKILWNAYLEMPDGPNEGRGRQTFRDPRSYRAGPQTDIWHAAVIGPKMRDGDYTRNGDTIGVTTGCSVTGALDTCGLDSRMEGTLKLSRDGTEIASRVLQPGWNAVSLEAALPQDAATYTLRESLTRASPVVEVSTAIDTAWTFRSARTPGAQGLPLMTVDLLPAGLDERNRAAKDRPTVVPFWVKRNPGAPASAVRSTKIEASFDDGKTWQNLRVTGTGGAGVVTVTPPPGAEFVSLRASATDRDGNAVVQTVTRAYRLG